MDLFGDWEFIDIVQSDETLFAVAERVELSVRIRMHELNVDIRNYRFEQIIESTTSENIVKVAVRAIRNTKPLPVDKKDSEGAGEPTRTKVVNEEFNCMACGRAIRYKKDYEGRHKACYTCATIHEIDRDTLDVEKLEYKKPDCITMTEIIDPSRSREDQEKALLNRFETYIDTQYKKLGLGGLGRESYVDCFIYHVMEHEGKLIAIALRASHKYFI